MLNFIYFIPALPFAGFIILSLIGRRLSKTTTAFVGVGSVGMSALLSVLMAIEFTSNPPEGREFVKTLWTWMEVDGFASAVSLFIDPLSLIMILVITIVGFFIHLYSVEFMLEDLDA